MSLIPIPKSRDFLSRKRRLFGGRGVEYEKKDSPYLQKSPSKTNQKNIHLYILTANRKIQKQKGGVHF